MDRFRLDRVITGALVGPLTRDNMDDRWNVCPQTHHAHHLPLVRVGLCPATLRVTQARCTPRLLHRCKIQVLAPAAHAQ